MRRGRKVIFVAHCLLNTNARVDGLSKYEGIHPLLAEFEKRGYGVIQLPCPEMLAEGPGRPPVPKEVYDTPSFRELCTGLAEEVAGLVDSYRNGGYEVSMLVGIEGSPSCGVTVTNIADNGSEWRVGDPTHRVPGSGVFVDALRTALAGVGVEFVAVDGRDDDLGVRRVVQALEDEVS